MDKPINYDRLPPHLRGGARRWIEKGIRPGGFMLAVLENDLVDAVGRADDESMAALRDIVRFWYNEAPSECWGSPGHVAAWAEFGGLHREVEA